MKVVGSAKPRRDPAHPNPRAAESDPLGAQRSGPRAGDEHAASKRQAREDRIRRRRVRVRARATLAVSAIVALLVAGFAIYRSPLFPVRSIKVSGADHLSPAEVAALAKVPEGATLLRFPTRQVAQRVSSSPWVGDVTVNRDFPDTIRIQVVEREPAALLDLGKTVWLVDGSAYVIARESLDQTSSLAVVRDVRDVDPKPGEKLESKTLVNALDLLSEMDPALRRQVKLVSAGTIEGTSVITDDRVEIVFGRAEDVARKDFIARRILRDQGGKAFFIDVRNTARPVWRGLRD